MSYLIWGFVSSAFFLASIPAICHQLVVINRRKKLIKQGMIPTAHEGEGATHSIAVNQIFASFAGVYSFLLFGLVLDSPDPFLVYPRAVVATLLFLILVELHRDRNDRATAIALGISSVSLGILFVILALGIRTVNSVQRSSEIVVLAATVLMAHGAYAQYRLLRRNQARGAVSLPMHATLYLKDFTGMMFGFQIGWSAWSIILMHLSNLVMRAPIIYQYLKLSKS
jgi:hypothetical protein